MNTHIEVSPDPLFSSTEQIIEKVLALSDWTPVQIFGVLFPLWDVDVVGIQGEEQEYPFFEKIIERGIAQTGLTSEAALADFLGLDLELVERLLVSLEAAGRLVRIDGQFHLAPVAVRSAHEGKKYVPSQTHVKLFFEGYYSRPLPNVYYDGVKVLSLVEAEDFVQERLKAQIPFYRLYSFRRWSPLAVKEVALREDRTAYHVPADMEQLTLLRVTPAYVPMYVVEARKQSTPYYLVFSAAQDGRDEFFEKLVNSYAEVLLPFSGEVQRDFTQMWDGWQKEHGLKDVPIERLDNGLWRATIPADVLRSEECKITIPELGSYHVEGGYFLHLWCENELLRCQAALDQVLQAIQRQPDTITLPEVETLLGLSIDRLQTPKLEVTDLLVRAEETDNQDMAQLLHKLMKELESEAENVVEKAADSF